MPSSPSRDAFVRQQVLLRDDPSASHVLDRLASLASRILRAPVAQVNLVASDRQVSLSSVGPGPWSGPREVTLELSYCQHAVASGEPLVVEDAREHPQVRESRATTESGIVAYAGVPLLHPEEGAVGTLCVVDFQRRAWTEEEMAVLSDLSTAAMAELELRDQVQERERAEEALRAARDELDLRVRERTAELEEESAQRRRTAEALRESQERLELLVGQMPALLWSTDAQLRITWGAGQPAGEVELKAEEILGRTLGEFLGVTDDSFPPIEAHRRALRGDSSSYETEWMGRSFVCRVQPILDPRGEIEGVAGVAFDVTENREVERKLRESEERYRQMFERNTAIKLLIDPSDGRIVDANPAADRFYGYSPGELRKKRITDLNVLSPEQVRAEMQRAAQEERTYFVFPHRLASGEVRAVEVHTGPIDVGGRHLLYSILHDVTDRQRAEEALRRSEEHLRATFEQAAVGIAHVGLDGRWLRVNQRLCGLVGYSREELLRLTFQEITHPEDLDADLRLLKQLRRGEISYYQLEKRYLHREGHPVWILLTVSLVRDASGEPEYYIAVVEDVSARREAEEALRASREQLLHAQKMEAVGRLAGGVAHDFNNVLTAIKSTVQILLLDVPADAPIRDDLQEVDAATSRAAALTRQLLAFSRKQVLQPRVFDLNQVVRDLDRMLHRLIGEEVELKYRLDPGLGPVKADPGQMEQVLVNLVVNARDAMPRGGTVAVETRDLRVPPDEEHVPSHVPPGSYVLLRVSDTGTGMDEATRARVFEPFFTTKEPGKGTGMGLSTVYGIVAQSGGYVWVESEVGRGTAVSVLLPRTAEGAGEGPHARRPEPSSGREVVLLVEDDLAVRRSIRRLLERSGYVVLEAEGGPAALALCRELDAPVDLVVSDVVMPEMSGPELREEISRVWPGVKVLYISGYTSDRLRHREALEPGVHLLEKPFTLEALAHKVREVLDAE